jgi:hypothetical protein
MILRLAVVCQPSALIAALCLHKQHEGQATKWRTYQMQLLPASTATPRQPPQYKRMLISEDAAKIVGR